MVAAGSVDCLVHLHLLEGVTQNGGSCSQGPFSLADQDKIGRRDVELLKK